MRDFFKNKYVRHLLAAAAVVVVLMVIFMFWINGYTRHDETYPAPDLHGIDASQAARTLEQAGFRWTIIDSSRYEPGQPPRAVLSQDPSAGTDIKLGRKIYLKINRSSWENGVIPSVDFENDKVDNVSRRLTAAGFTVGATIYQPHIGRDVVLGLSAHGRNVHPGQKLPKKTVVNIIAGDGGQAPADEDTLSVDDF